MRMLIAAAGLLVAGPALAQGVIPYNGYVKPNGTYVQPHYQTAPNNTTADNYSTRGNVNPYTGTPGTVNPSPAYTPYRPASPRY